VNFEPSLVVYRLKEWWKKVVLPHILCFKFKGNVFTLQSAWVMGDGRTNSICYS